MGADVALLPEMWSIGYTFFAPGSKFIPWRAPEFWLSE
jgi:hypothetical protein